MLLSEKVKNLALIREAEISFGEGLNVITGETGAGKSLVIGSVELALGGKASGSIVRHGEDEASVELVFEAESEREGAMMRDLGIEIEDDGLVIMARKLKESRSTAKINGDTVNASVLKKAASALIDIHGQRDQMGLLSKRNLCAILDRYAGEGVAEPLLKVEEYYVNYKELMKELEEDVSDPDELKRREDLLRFEVMEIEEAELKPGEDTEIEERYNLMKNARKIAESLSDALGALSENSAGNASDCIGRASSGLTGIQGIDEKTDAIINRISEIEALIGDVAIDIGDRLRSMDFSEEEYEETEQRMDLINHLKSKYGKSIEEIYEALEKKQAELGKIEDHDSYLADLKGRLEISRKELKTACSELSKKRVSAAAKLQEEMKDALSELNFENVEFSINVVPDEDRFTSGGYDTVSFMISLNRGEALQPLEDVASGGELSRIMLALKTVLADTDDIPTLIFDEIDTGISGRTAEKVAEKLAVLSEKRQVIAITHLPQIAAMADHHFIIEKTSDDTSTETSVRELTGDEPVDELSRLLSGSAVTDTVRENAREMLALAREFKHKIK